MNNRRNLLVDNKSDSGFVDLGLPSGLKWASGNLLKSGSSWVIGNETDYGDFWSWGNVGDSSDTGYAQSEGGVMTPAMYNSTSGKLLTGDIPTDAAYDVARNRLGVPWRLPSKADFDELVNNTDQQWVYMDEIQGCKFMKKTDHSVYILLPASGYCASSGLNQRNSQGYYWSSSSYDSGNYAYYLNFGNSKPSLNGTNGLFFGYSIRPVYSVYRTVTITVTNNTVEGISLTLTDREGVQHTATTDASGTVKFTSVAYGKATLSADGKDFSPYSITVSASAGSFTVEMFIARFVDLGLPSGLKWATGNIISSGNNGYKIGEEMDYGAYFSWGNIVPHFSSNNSTFDDDYSWGNSNNSNPYVSTPGSGIIFTSQGEGFSEDSGYDAARELLGSKWKMPTTLDFKELNDNCTSTWVTDYNGSGVNGRLFKSKINGATLFFPAAGYGLNSFLFDLGSYGYYWSRSLYSSDYGYNLYFYNGSSVRPQFYGYRYYGRPVRPVQ